MKKVFFGEGDDQKVSKLLADGDVEGFSIHGVFRLQNKFLIIKERMKEMNVPRLKFSGGTKIPGMSFRDSYIKELTTALAKSLFSQYEQDEIIKREADYISQFIGTDYNGPLEVRNTLVVKFLIETSLYLGPESNLKLLTISRVESTKDSRKDFLKFFACLDYVFCPSIVSKGAIELIPDTYKLEKNVYWNFVSSNHLVLGIGWLDCSEYEQLTPSHQDPAKIALDF